MKLKVERFKVRLVAKGCSQKPGIDYEETYSPVVRYISIRLLMALAAEYDLDIDQVDVRTEFWYHEEGRGNLHRPAKWLSAQERNLSAKEVNL